MKYYRDGLPVGELKVPEIKSEREAELQVIAAENTFEIGQLLEATVAVFKKPKVTYELLDAIRITQKEYKFLKSCTIVEGQKIKVEITELKADGSIKKVKPQCPE